MVLVAAFATITYYVVVIAYIIMTMFVASGSLSITTSLVVLVIRLFSTIATLVLTKISTAVTLVFRLGFLLIIINVFSMIASIFLIFFLSLLSWLLLLL